MHYIELTMISWPSRAKNALVKLFEPLQDIDVYVEDENDEVFYRALLKHACQDKIKIARVFSLGGRDPVINAAQQHDHSLRRALFIIDGDLNWTVGNAGPSIVGLYQHDAYCVENLLFCEKAFISILSQETIVSEEKAKANLNISEWLQFVKAPLVKLFSAYGTSYLLTPDLPTVSGGVGNLCIKATSSGGSTRLCPTKANLAVDKLLSEVKAKVEERIVIQTFSSVLKRLNELDNPLHGVSGKDFLIPLIDFWLQELGCRIKRKTLRLRLACTGDVTRFSDLNSAMHNAARGFV